MGWREYQDELIAAGIGPENVEDTPCDPPSFITVTVFLPTTFRDIDTGELMTIDAPQSRSWPMFAEKAAWRWAKYWEKRRGKNNVWIDYD